MANAAKIILAEGDAAATPAAGTVVIYCKTDDKFYKKTSAGVESEISASPTGIGNVVEDTTPQLGGNLDLNTFSFDISAAPAADTWEGSTITITKTGTMVLGSLCYINSAGQRIIYKNGRRL